jgi:hypothetical protein
MIVSNQSNLKVHFAGLENQDFAEVLHQCGGINYSLFTVFPFIANEVGIKPLKMKTVLFNHLIIYKIQVDILLWIVVYLL